MHVFLQPIVKALAKLELHGMLVKVWDMLERITTKVIVLVGTCGDLPAKSLMLNLRQFNGFNGCAKCLQSGKTLKLGPRAHTHIYPFNKSDPSGPLRSQEGIEEDVKYYLETGSSRNGILEPSWMGSLKYFNMATGMGIDYMH